ncbi:MAG TPA: hypothetical protein VII56_08745 [Rhizomicrobium sp.]
MPKKSHAKRNKKNPTRTPEQQREAIYDLVADMEEPLNAALDLSGVLYFMGLGLSALEDDAANPILTLASTQTRQLEKIKTMWKAIFAASGEAK